MMKKRKRGKLLNKLQLGQWIQLRKEYSDESEDSEESEYCDEESVDNESHYESDDEPEEETASQATSTLTRLGIKRPRSCVD